MSPSRADSIHSEASQWPAAGDVRQKADGEHQDMNQVTVVRHAWGKAVALTFAIALLVLAFVWW